MTVFQKCQDLHRYLIAQGNIPDEGLRSETHQIIASALTRNTRGYIEKISNQINGSFERGWFDACAVMARRLIETLIIEAFENHNISSKIKDTSGNFLFLRDLIDASLNEQSWNLTRNTRSALPKLKDLGDKSAHSRRFNAIKDDIERLRDPMRVVVQEFIYLAKLK